MNILHLIGRNKELFTEDISGHEKELSEIVSSSRFLVIGGAGSIGQAVTKEIFKRNPQKMQPTVAPNFVKRCATFSKNLFTFCQFQMAFIYSSSLKLSTFLVQKEKTELMRQAPYLL
ncbi:hypothetical protein SAMN05444280_11983 [Tangfeifania diversioriginum]|uniref:Polysaccharide biosynthesis protein n=1 Tax=Tangfeifania diversioriginum TaxID=1168035 RepID=A0A1M6JC40_9BACT|nr:hypothetical protein [Tangfeifania diversioriginum]SHJ44237.1 hypothetical protein SAMN05444280_11983 [Tangfeifania diversioriginum]